jgi:hypothetical protein
VSARETLSWTSSLLSFEASSSRCLRVACSPLERGALLLEPTQRLFSHQVFPLERSLGLDEESPLLQKRGLRLLARGLLLMELLLRRGERGGLVRQARPQPLGLLGLLLILTLPGLCPLEGRAVPLKLGTSRGHLGLPLRHHGARPTRSSRALCSASSRSTSAAFTLSTVGTSSAAWASSFGGWSRRPPPGTPATGQGSSGP